MEETKHAFESLPTGKPHVSFSEVKLWKECSWRHKLVHVDKVGASLPSPILTFGTVIHASCESFLLTRKMDIDECIRQLGDEWRKNADQPGFTEETLQTACQDAKCILEELPAFFDRTFSEWETIDAEHNLYEPIDGHPHAFKGFIDAVIKTKGKRGEDLIWILDYKTSQRGWFKDKRSDETLKYQLALYKNYWLAKHPEVKMKDVRCGFVILKKDAKPGNHCELFTVSLGPVPIKRSLTVMSNMITTLKRGIAIKNREACKWCEFRETEKCTLPVTCRRRRSRPWST